MASIPPDIHAGARGAAGINVVAAAGGTCWRESG